MNLYKTTFSTIATTVVGSPVGGITTKSVWHGSAGDASKGRTALKAEHKGCKPETVIVDVPTTKTDLLNWLNAQG